MSLRALTIAALAAVAVIAVMRCLIVFAPQVYFDVDPALEPSALAAMSIYGSLVLDVLLLLFLAVGFVCAALDGRGMQWRLLIAALLPVPIVLHHAWNDAGDLWRGSTWVAGALAAVFMAHVARHRQLRIMAAALLLAVLGPLLVRGLAQVTYEHADTLAAYEIHREQFLQDRGWEPDSPSALIYERRLRQPQPLGWFATTNIYASVMAAGLVVCAALAIGAVRARLSSGWAGVMALVAVAALGGIVLGGSKGAMLAALAAAALCLTPLVLPASMSILLRYGSVLVLAVVGCALLGVFVRGALLPEGFLNDRSLLFRWHYMVSSWEVFKDNPWLGVGPDGFQEAYAAHRLPRNPEEVASAHSMFIDWLCTLGVAGIGWVAMVVMTLWRGGKSIAQDGQALDDRAMEALLRTAGPLFAGAALVAVIAAMAVEWHTLDSLAVVVRIIGGATFAALALMILYVAGQVQQRVFNWALAIGALAVVVHGQIEMTFFQSGYVVWGLCLIGLAAGAALERTDRPAAYGRFAGLCAAAVAVALALWLLAVGVVPAASQQQLVREAVAAVHPPAATAANQVQQRVRAAQLLVQAYEQMPSDPLPLRHAARQYELAAALSANDDAGAAHLRSAIEIADRAAIDHPSTSARALRGALRAQLAALTGDESLWNQAIADARAVTAADPNGISPWAALGDYLWAARRRAEAAEAYRRALLVDHQFELDPLKQLSQRRRREIEQRLAVAEDR